MLARPTQADKPVDVDKAQSDSSTIDQIAIKETDAARVAAIGSKIAE